MPRDKEVERSKPQQPILIHILSKLKLRLKEELGNKKITHQMI